MNNHIKKQHIALMAVLTLTLFACTSAIDEQGYSYDPWEGFNRKVFVFNDTVDTILLKPIASGYKWIMPQFGENRVNAFFGNIGDMGSFANSVLQLEFKQSGQILARVINNTFFGLGGLFDVATPMGNGKIYEDFGSTLDHYGVNSGPYLMLPLLGPSTLRDGFGRVVDSTLISPVAHLEPERNRWILTGTDLIRTRANLLATERSFAGDIGDKYLLMRDSWLQYRWKQLYGEDAISGQQDAFDAIFEAEQTNIEQ